VPSREQTFRIAVRKFGPFEAAIRQQWEAFEADEQTGLELDLVSFDLHALEEALFTSGGMANGEWDVAFVATDWIAAMHERKCAVDLKALLDREPPQDYPQGWSASLLRLQRIGESVLGVPYHDGPECLIYRRDLFDDPALRRRFESQFHRPLAPPATWAEFHQVARFMQSAVEGLYGTVFAAYPDGHNSVYDFLLQVWTRGGELVDAEGELHFSTPQSHDALSFYREVLNDAEAVHPDCRELDSVAAGARFAAGEVTMMVNWFGFAAHAHTSDTSTVRDVVDIADIPAVSPEFKASLNVYWILSIASGSPHRELAWRFLRHCQTPAMDKLTTTNGAIGCRKSTWTDPAVNAEIPFYRRLEKLHESAREIPQRADWPRIAAIIDSLVTATISTATPISVLLAQADEAYRDFK
jgi:multiple sugar transport system substrate-binding protein